LDIYNRLYCEQTATQQFLDAVEFMNSKHIFNGSDQFAIEKPGQKVGFAQLFIH